MSAMEPCSTPLIELLDVDKIYGHTAVIENLNLAVLRGEFLTLLGPSGCGKTTTLKMVAGFEKPTRGQIVLDGQDVSGVPPYGRNLNTVFQQYALFPHLSVFENVAFGPRTRRVDGRTVKERVEGMLDMVHMLEHARKKPNQLSGGQQQRVALARALVNYPSALLLDEPLSALDVKLRRAMQLELKKIQAEVDTTFIFVTHDQEEALTMSSRIAVMNGGRIEQLGSPEEIYYRPTTAFVANFIGQANLLRCQVAGRNNGYTRVSIEGGGQAHVARELPSADKVWLMVRPEQLGLRAHAPEDAQRFDLVTGELREIGFQGALTRYVVRLATGGEMTVTLSPRDQPASALKVDQKVTVHWDPAHAWLVTA